VNERSVLGHHVQPVFFPSFRSFHRQKILSLAAHAPYAAAAQLNRCREKKNPQNV
jgi:hypothetical protein